MSTREELIAKFKASTTEKEKAQIELELWAGTTPEERAVSNRRVWLATLLGVEQNQTGCRVSILNLGEAGEKIWTRIQNKEMALATGSRLACEARELFRVERSSFGGALDAVLTEYDRLPNVRYVDGIQIRQKNPVSRASVLESKGPKQSPAEQKVLDDAEKPFWEALRLKVLPFVANRLQGVEPIIAERLSLEFERDLKILLSDFKKKIYNATKSVNGRAKVAFRSMSRAKVRAACEALNMAVPEMGKPANMAEALSKKWQVAKAYHPDSNGGLETESTREKLKAALDAYDCLEEYNATLSNGANPHG